WPGGLGFGGERDGGGGVFDRVDEVDDAEPVWWPDGAGLLGVGGVEADDGVEVGHASALQFGDLAVGDLDRVRVKAVSAGPMAEVSFDGDAGASPQFAG